MGMENTESGSSLSKASQFLTDCKEELKKVVKPTREETVRATGVTIFILLFVAIVLALFDVFFNRAMNIVFGV